MSFIIAEREIACTESKLLSFLADPLNLKDWTVHRDLYIREGKCFEANTLNGDIVFYEIVVKKRGSKLSYSWFYKEQVLKTFHMEVFDLGFEKAKLIFYTDRAPEASRLSALEKLIAIEMVLLEGIVSDKKEDLSMEDAIFLQKYHNNLNK